jgi:hypothetical protein
VVGRREERAMSEWCVCEKEMKKMIQREGERGQKKRERMNISMCE